MNPFHAALLGLIEGVTEYLPVSANAHVIILGNLLGEPADLVKSFGVALQAAPTLAVIILFWRRFEGLITPTRVKKTTFKGQRAWQLMALGTLPVLIIGFIFKKYFYDLMLSPWPSVIGLGLGGLAILIAESIHKEKGASDINSISASQALIIGFCQCLALWPGVSRSGATMVAGILVGLHRKDAAEFSFLVGVPIFLAASGLEFLKSGVLKENLFSFGIAFAVSFVCALVTVKIFMKLLAKFTFRPYGWYRIALCPILWRFFG